MGRMSRRKNLSSGMFNSSAAKNGAQYSRYVEQFLNIALSRFKWDGLPPTIDERFLERTLLFNGGAVFFADETLGFLCLPFTSASPLDLYNLPRKRRAYASTGYQKELGEEDSALIFNNYLMSPSYPAILEFASRLWEIDRSIDVNVRAQKTPVLIQCDSTELLTMQNLYKQYDGNTPVIFGRKSVTPESIRAITTGAPFVAGQLYDIKVKIYNEFLTYMGISNVAHQKKERLLHDEVARELGGTFANRYSAISARQQACDEINRKFGLGIWCEFREEADNGELYDASSDDLREPSED